MTDPLQIETSNEAWANRLAKEAPVLLVLATIWAFSIWARPQLPASVPIHFNLLGQADRWGSAAKGAFLTPAIATGLYLLILALGVGNQSFLGGRGISTSISRVLRLLMVFFMSAMHVATLAPLLGVHLVLFQAILACLGIISLTLSFLMPQLEPNFWVGYRLPPTLEDPRIWRNTHQLAGQLWAIGGLLEIGLLFLPFSLQWPILLVTLATIFLVPVIYAYHLRGTSPPPAI